MLQVLDVSGISTETPNQELATHATPAIDFLSMLVIFGLFQRDCHLFAQSPKEITNSIGMKLVLIPKGTFMMGSPESEEGREKNENQHEVTISKDYYLGVCEVTQAQYEKVLGKNPSLCQGALDGNENADRPVENVSWGDAVEFCKKLSDLPEEKKVGRGLSVGVLRQVRPVVPAQLQRLQVALSSSTSPQGGDELKR
jgi:formylglycine-generating enzyme required for sulfatase activity